MVVTKSIQIILNMLHLGVPQCQTHILLIIMKDFLVYVSEIQKFQNNKVTMNNFHIVHLF